MEDVECDYYSRIIIDVMLLLLVLMGGEDNIISI